MTETPKKIKQLVILSGKGGTGKTSLTAAFAHLSHKELPPGEVIFVDGDVDAANLDLVIKPVEQIRTDFWGGSLAEIDPKLCQGSGDCVPVCRYDALFPDPRDPSVYWVDPIACDGCAACVYACPQNAIQMVRQQEGHWFRSETTAGTLFHAELFPGRENSGKLVTMIKQQARLWAEDHTANLIIIDGPPGIGCPVISACAGTDLGLVVTEPSVSGLHDLQRILGTLKYFGIPAVISINKADLYPQGTQQILDYTSQENLEIIGQIPFDEKIPESMLQGLPITELFPESPAALAISQLWQKSLTLLKNL